MATRMANLGCMEAFTIETDWDEYEERLQAFFIANDVADAKKVHVTISLLGKQAYSTLRDICLPDLPSSKSFAERFAIHRSRRIHSNALDQKFGHG